MVWSIYIFTPIPGEMIQFDEHIFQMGWNHQGWLWFCGHRNSYGPHRVLGVIFFSTCWMAMNLHSTRNRISWNNFGRKPEPCCKLLFLCNMPTVKWFYTNASGRQLVQLCLRVYGFLMFSVFGSLDACLRALHTMTIDAWMTSCLGLCFFHKWKPKNPWKSC